MTRGRLVWLALLAVALVAGLLLRVPKKERAATEPAARPSAFPGARNGDHPGEVEVEVADPRELERLVRPVASASGGEKDNEDALLRDLAGAWDSDPARALALSDEGERRFGESPRAVERRLFEIRALVKLERIGKARSKAERYLELYPPGPMTDEVERLTGVHRRPPP
jgi:hypothetical protein